MVCRSKKITPLAPVANLAGPAQARSRAETRRDSESSRLVVNSPTHCVAPIGLRLNVGAGDARVGVGDLRDRSEVSQILQRLQTARIHIKTLVMILLSKIL